MSSGWSVWGPRVRTFAGLLRDFAYIFLFFTPIFLATVYGIYRYYSPTIIGLVREELGIDKIAAQIEELPTKAMIEELAVGVRRATGEDRVIRMPPGLSYIEEPVHAGEVVTMILLVERTSLGANCRLKNWVPLFTDRERFTTPGERLISGPPRRQVGTQLVPLRLQIVPPANLKPGRVELYLTLEYQCGDRTVFDRTDTLVYELLPS